MGPPRKPSAEGKIVSRSSGISLLHVFLVCGVVIWFAYEAGDKSRNVYFESLLAGTTKSADSSRAKSPSAFSLSDVANIVAEEDLRDEDHDSNEEEDQDDHTVKPHDHTVKPRQLFLDLDNVSKQLISSKSEVQQILAEVGDVYDAEIVGQSCHETEGATVISCIGVLAHSGHISIHVWPNSNTVILDIFLEEDSILDGLPSLSEVFYPNQLNQFDNENVLPGTQDSLWHISPRASRHAMSDLDFELLSGEGKYKVASVRTDFQQIDVFDFISKQSAYDIRDCLEKDPAYFHANPKLFVPDRLLFLDGVTQSTLEGNAAYHEALVQPSMFAHKNPKRVAIIGGGECATLREVLKHDTIDKVVMVEIDPGVIEVSKYALPDWNDCSNIVGSSRYCMDDPRAEIYNEDAFKWFIDRYLGRVDVPQEELFDVIIVDALDPQNVVDFAKALYGDDSFLGSLYDALSKNGILVTQVGNSPRLNDPPEEHSQDANRIVFVDSLTAKGFQSIADYSEAHAGFEQPWYYYAAFKNLESRTEWHANEAYFNLQIQKRAVRTVDGTSPFEYFDGPTMMGYQVPSKGSVALFCRRSPIPPRCEKGHGFNPEIPNFTSDNFVVKSSTVGDFAGRGVFATTDIPEHSYTMLEGSIYPVMIEALTEELLILLLMENDIAFNHTHYGLDGFADLYGYASNQFGSRATLKVDTGILTFVNHGCNGTSNLGEYPNITDSTVDPDEMPEVLLRYKNEGKGYVFNPAHIRNSAELVEQIAFRSIKAGEELLENYYEQSDSDWKEQVKLLRGWCSGKVGEVERYQNENKESGESDESCPNE